MNDIFAVRAVIIILGAFAIVGLVGVMFRTVDAAVIGLIGSAVGALSSMLVSVRTGHDVQSVMVENKPSDPVPTKEEKK